MKLNLTASNSLPYFNFITPPRKLVLYPFPLPRPSNPHPNRFLFSIHHHHHSSKPSPFVPICFSNPTNHSNTNEFHSNSNVELDAGNSNHITGEEELEENLNVQLANPVLPSYIQSIPKLSLSDQAFFLLSFIAFTTSVAFTGLVVAAVPTLYAMKRAATSLSKLADTAREELPSTMAAIRLSGMEISDLTLELSDLSQEIADGVNKSAQAVQAAEAGIRQIGSLAHHHTVSMIEERANLPIISLRPVVVGAAKKTSRAVGQATKTLMNMISRTENEDDRVEI